MSSLAGTEGRGTLFLGFGGASGKEGHAAVGLGVAYLNFFLGVTLLLFSGTSLFLTFGLVSGSGGLNWVPGAGTGIGPILPSISRNVFIFFMIMGCRQSLMLQGVHLISWVMLSLLKICVPCIDVIFNSTSTTSTGSLHLI